MTSDIIVSATLDQVFATLTDYERYADWAPDVVSANVLAREGDIVVAEFYSPELMDEAYQLEFIHSKPVSVIYKQKGIFEKTGRLKRGLSGSWSVTKEPNRQAVRVTASMALQGRYRQHLANRKKAKLVLQRRLDVLQHMFDPLPTGHSLDIPLQDSGKEILELFETAEGREIWIYGNRYRLTRTDRL